MNAEFPKRDQWRKLPSDSPREHYFDVLQAAVREYYLADPSNRTSSPGEAAALSGGKRHDAAWSRQYTAAVTFSM
jgi:hypothetical protein